MWVCVRAARARCPKSRDLFWPRIVPLPLGARTRPISTHHLGELLGGLHPIYLHLLDSQGLAPLACSSSPAADLSRQSQSRGGPTARGGWAAAAPHGHPRCDKKHRERQPRPPCRGSTRQKTALCCRPKTARSRFLRCSHHGYVANVVSDGSHGPARAFYDSPKSSSFGHASFWHSGSRALWRPRAAQRERASAA